jgi:hypothetical protein
MPFIITVATDTTMPLVRLQGVGALSLDDLRDALTTLITMGVVETPRLVDFSGATLRVSALQVRAYAQFKQAHLNTYKAVRVAAIAPDPKVFAILRVYQGLIWGQEPDYYLFRTVQEGMQWLEHGS